ncbi:MAG: hypothetical protein ACLTMP_11120 [Eggerthella lenta]
MGWSLSISAGWKCSPATGRGSLPLIAVAYLIDTLLPPLTSSLFPGGRSVMLLVVRPVRALLWCLRAAFVAQQMKNHRRNLHGRGAFAHEARGRRNVRILADLRVRDRARHPQQPAVRADRPHRPVRDHRGRGHAGRAAGGEAAQGEHRLHHAHHRVVPGHHLAVPQPQRRRRARGRIADDRVPHLVLRAAVAHVHQRGERAEAAGVLPAGLGARRARLSVALGRCGADAVGANRRRSAARALGSVWLLVATLALMFCSYLRCVEADGGDAGPRKRRPRWRTCRQAMRSCR